MSAKKLAYNTGSEKTCCRTFWSVELDENWISNILVQRCPFYCSLFMLLTRNDIYLIFPFFSEVSSSQVNFFKMLDEKIENVSLYKLCFNNHFDHFTSIFCPNSIILELHGMHFKLSAHCFYQTISQCISNKSNHWSLKYKFESYFS